MRQSLIDPFFEALVWDVGNKAMIAPQYREVVPEDSLDVEGQHKAPDYTFRVGAQPKFYAEAKKCGIHIGVDPAPAFQLRRYGWSANLALSILTDFEDLAVYDCTLRPRPGERASRARIQHFHFEEYPDRWRELWDVFSREAVWSGAFDQYAASKRKRGTSEVDQEFLKEMEGWLLALAGNMALRNKGLSLDDLNAAVQLTIDRIVFLRMAEDRGLEPYEQLLKLCDRTDIYSRFMRDLCKRAATRDATGRFRGRVPADECNPTCGAEHGPGGRRRHRRAHRAARRLRCESEEKKADRRVLWLLEGDSAAAQAETPRAVQSGVDIHLRGGGLQPGADAESGQAVAADRLNRCRGVPWEPKTGFQGKESLSMARSKYPKYGRKERKSRTNDGFFSSLPGPVAST